MDLEPFYDAVKDAIRAVWPETVTNGIHESEHEMAIAFVTKTLPFASICSGPFNPGKWGVANYNNLFMLSLCYTARWKGTLTSQRDKINAMERYLRSHRELGTGRVVQASATFGWGDGVPANKILERTNMSQRVIAVRTQVVIGESLNPPLAGVA